MKRIFLFLIIVILFVAGVASADKAKSNRAFEGAPPTIPHTIEGREDCLMCHKDGIGGAPKASHPERLNCDQCHVPGE